MPRHGGSGGRWVPKSSGKSKHVGKGRGRKRNAQVPPSSANFPQVQVDFKSAGTPSSPAAEVIKLPRRKRGPARHKKTLQQ